MEVLHWKSCFFLVGNCFMWTIRQNSSESFYIFWGSQYFTMLFPWLSWWKIIGKPLSLLGCSKPFIHNSTLWVITQKRREKSNVCVFFTKKKNQSIIFSMLIAQKTSTLKVQEKPKVKKAHTVLQGFVNHVVVPHENGAFHVGGILEDSHCFTRARSLRRARQLSDPRTQTTHCQTKWQMMTDG